MSGKTIFIIIITVLVTIILMNNTEQVDFWIFGDARVSKLAILGVFFGAGLIVGFMAGRPRRKEIISAEETDPASTPERTKTLSYEDRDYIN